MLLKWESLKCFGSLHPTTGHFDPLVASASLSLDYKIGVGNKNGGLLKVLGQ